MALTKSKGLVVISKRVFEFNKEIYEFIADYLLSVKCMIKNDKITEARENLLALEPLI